MLSALAVVVLTTASVTAGAFTVGSASGATATGQAWVPIDLGTVGGYHSITSSFRSAVLNDSGQVVGMSTDVSGTWHAFSWTPATGMIDLGEGRANAVNEYGQVVGQVNWHAFSWTESGGMTDIGTLGGASTSTALAVNDAGQVVGESGSGGWWDTRAFLWTPTGGITAIGSLGGGTSSAVAINGSGQVVGTSATGSGYSHAFLWAAGTILDLGTLPGGNRSDAIAINDEGKVVGYAETHPYLSNNHAFLWTNGSMIDLGTLGGDRSAAMDINAAGQIAGYSQTSSGVFHAVLWTDGSQIDLGTFGGASYAYAVNDAGTVVGHSETPSGDRHAFAWTAETGMVDLGTLGGRESFAFAVNAGGQVVGQADLSLGNSHAVLWTNDTTAPVIDVPSDLVTNATGPAGATVEFTATARDENPASPDVTCVPPSGSVFPIGTTTVVCTATDNAGNTGSASFTITVKGASEQLADLLGAVTGVGPGTSLADKVVAAQAAHASGDTARTCEILNAFINQVEAQPEKNIASGTASTLIADATQIRAVLGC